MDDIHLIEAQFAQTALHLHMIEKCGCDCEDAYCPRCGPIKYPQIMDVMAPYWYGGVPRPTPAAPADNEPVEHPLLRRFERHLTRNKIARAYEVCLTLDPQLHPSKEPYFLVKSFYKVVASRIFNVVDWLYCIELQENGYPHMHALVITNRKPVQTNKIKQMYPYRSTFARVKDLIAYVNYIHKEEHNPAVNAYCKKYGTPQIASKAVNRPAQADAQAQNVQEKVKDLCHPSDDLVLHQSTATLATSVSDQACT